MTLGPLPYGAGFLVLTHRLFQGNAIWGRDILYLLVLARARQTALSSFLFHILPSSRRESLTELYSF